MKIIIPAAGEGQRFKDSGYKQGKPFIKVGGATILEHQLKEFAQDDVQVILREEYRTELELQRIQFAHPKVKFIFCKPTNSVVETILHADTTGEIVVVDCDIIINRKDIIKANGNFILYFKDTKLIPRYSYIQTDSSNNIIEIIEKHKIGDKACCGVYGYKNGFSKLHYDQTAETHQSHYIRKLINKGQKFKAIKANSYINLGTPHQLQRNAQKIKLIKKIYCFDLDQTLVTRSKDGSHTDCQPIHENIKICNKLYEIGHEIIILTARRMLTHKGDVQKVIDDIGDTTKKQLHTLGIKHHKLIFGKPYADNYVDDKAVHAGGSLGKDLGIYFNGHQPRSFNKIRKQNGWIFKEGATIENEIYWYKNINNQWRKKYTPEFDTLGNILRLKELIGRTASEIYTSGEPLSLEKYISGITNLHDIKTSTTTTKEAIKKWYLDKLNERYDPKIYPKGSRAVYKKLVEWCNNYEVERVTEIHGDPVFTNAIKIKSGYRYFDPRGKIGPQKTIHGDPMYDLAKIYQSIIGYDFILAKSRIYESHTSIFKDQFINITGCDRAEIKIFAAYLYFTLIPLHEENRNKFYEMAVKLLK